MRRTGSTAALTMTMGCLVAAGGAAAAAVAAGHESRAPGPRAFTQTLDVLPFPGTPDAAPGTNIDLPAASRAQVQSVIGVGSRSGLHAGHLSAQPAGNGTAFTPDRPFSPGERVSVTATFRSDQCRHRFRSTRRKADHLLVFSGAARERTGKSGPQGQGRPPPRDEHLTVAHPQFRYPPRLQPSTADYAR